MANMISEYAKSRSSDYRPVPCHSMRGMRIRHLPAALLDDLWPDLICLLDVGMVEHRCHVDCFDHNAVEYMPVFCPCGHVYMVWRHGSLCTMCEKCQSPLLILKDYTATQLQAYPRKIQQIEIRQHLSDMSEMRFIK